MNYYVQSNENSNMLYKSHDLVYVIFIIII